MWCTLIKFGLQCTRLWFESLWMGMRLDKLDFNTTATSNDWHFIGKNCFKKWSKSILPMRFERWNGDMLWQPSTATLSIQTKPNKLNACHSVALKFHPNILCVFVCVQCAWAYMCAAEQKDSFCDHYEFYTYCYCNNNNKNNNNDIVIKLLSILRFVFLSVQT